ncbi:hypothetical protein [Nocardia pseudobrasiliensis]|uniref:Uncharacterized protein n=1 Tax=Nocardia pseudobrasiliensis TaxID=45979 RepID=A0A370IEY6_9NOCA|nr:hypothetical protein [Nocardia pseudobrasiliensis]RDI68014.1 hypothetical protein DFR76_102415 [Nocardia pseudobrasiliensis]
MARTKDRLRHRKTIELDVPAHPSQVPFLRAVAETVTQSVDCGIDDIADAPSVLAAAALMLMEDAPVGAIVNCRIVCDGSEFHARLESLSRTGATLENGRFDWHTAGTTTSWVVGWQGAFDCAAGAYPVALEFGMGPGRSHRRG